MNEPQSSPQPAVLDVIDLGVTYMTSGSPREVLRDLSLSVAASEVVCLVGPSGCGKTSLLRCLGGLQRPTAGAANMHGNRIVGTPPGMSIVFQDYSRSLMPWLKVLDNVALPLRVMGVGRKERRVRAREILHAVGLDSVAEASYPWQLSGGMQQRVAIARGLISNPEVLLMDEPFASVDAQTRFELEDLVLRIRRDIGVSILLVTHDIDEAVYLADRVLVLAGRPASLVRDVAVGLGAERDQLVTRSTERFTELRTEILAEIQSSKLNPTPRAPRA